MRGPNLSYVASRGFVGSTDFVSCPGCGGWMTEAAKKRLELSTATSATLTQRGFGRRKMLQRDTGRILSQITTNTPLRTEVKIRDRWE